MPMKLFGCLCLCLVLTACEKQAESSATYETVEIEQQQSAPVTAQAVATDLIEQEPSNDFDFPPGRRFDYGPAKNTVMHVVGVRHDDALNLRAAPTANAKLVTSKAPGQLIFPQLLSLGSGWLPDTGGAWWQVEINHPENVLHGEKVWAHTNYLKPLATATNKTDEIIRKIGSDYSGVEQLKQRLIHLRSNDTNMIKSVVSQDEMGMDASGGSVQIELLGYKDDSVYGEIFYVTFTNLWDDSGADARKIIGQQIGQVIVTPVCQRGESNGLCL